MVQIIGSQKYKEIENRKLQRWRKRNIPLLGTVRGTLQHLTIKVKLLLLGNKNRTNEKPLAIVWRKAKIQAFRLVGITPGKVEGRERILLNERRTRISSCILLLTFHASVPSGAFKKF